jgi:hypothetical protein
MMSYIAEYYCIDIVSHTTLYHIFPDSLMGKCKKTIVNGVPLTPNCFPAVGFKMRNETPTSLTNWWCNTDTEYAFVGFSYDISLCEVLRDQLYIYIS